MRHCLYECCACLDRAAGHVDILAFSQWNKKDLTMPLWVLDWREEVKKPFGQMPWDTTYKACGA